MGLRFEGYAMLLFLVISILIIAPACNKNTMSIIAGQNGGISALNSDKN